MYRHHVTHLELGPNDLGLPESSFLTLKRTKTDIRHCDVAFEVVPGLQFVVERYTSPWKPLRARFITYSTKSESYDDRSKPLGKSPQRERLIVERHMRESSLIVLYERLDEDLPSVPYSSRFSDKILSDSAPILDRSSIT